MNVAASQSRAHEDELNVLPLAQHISKDAEEEIGIEAAFVNLVDDDVTDIRKGGDYILGPTAACLEPPKKDTCRYKCDFGLAARLVLAADRVANLLADLRTPFFTYTVREAEGGDSTRLGDDDICCLPEALAVEVIEYELYGLRRLPGTRLS